MQFFFYTFLVFYFLYTFSFALKFNKTDIYYNPRQKTIHNILIWIIPFLWITVLKTINQPLKPHFKNHTNEYDSSWWALGFFSLFHGTSFLSNHQDSEYNFNGKDSYENYDSNSDADSTLNDSSIN